MPLLIAKMCWFSTTAESELDIIHRVNYGVNTIITVVPGFSFVRSPEEVIRDKKGSEVEVAFLKTHQLHQHGLPSGNLAIGLAVKTRTAAAMVRVMSKGRFGRERPCWLVLTSASLTPYQLTSSRRKSAGLMVHSFDSFFIGADHF